MLTTTVDMSQCHRQPAFSPNARLGRQGASLEIDLKLAPGPRGAGQARRVLAMLGGKLSPEELRRLRLLVSELVANVPPRFGSPTDGSVELRITADQTTVRVEVRDLRTGSDDGWKPEADEEQATWNAYLLGQLSNRWGPLGEAHQDLWFEIDRAWHQG
jgi:hypothetical protein